MVKTWNNIGFQHQKIHQMKRPIPHPKELSELRTLQGLEQLDPLENATSRQTILNNFDRKNSMLSKQEIASIENPLVEFHDKFARHRFDIGMNEEFSVKLTQKDDSPAHSQSIPTPVYFKDDIVVELAHYTNMAFIQPSKYITDAAQHMVGKELFCKIDCSQAYHCLQMADQKSIELLAFSFACRTFAYKRLAQGLSIALSPFSSFLRDYLDKAIKANQCTQNVDDIRNAANTADQKTTNLLETFKCIRKAGLKLIMHKCHFGSTEINFLGRTITPEGVKPQKENVQNFLEKTKFPKSKKAL